MRTTNEHKLPWLGGLPVVGDLFRMRTQSTSKSEVFVILTPHVFRDRADAERFGSEEFDRIECFLRQQRTLSADK
jgi:type II secretory pathway component GspD/PulD (secretin)